MLDLRAAVLLCLTFSSFARAQADPARAALTFDPTTSPGQNLWNGSLVSSQVIAEQMQEALANAPLDGPERALYLRTWACLIDAAVMPRVVAFETAFEVCTSWSSGSFTGHAQPSDKTPYTSGRQNAQTIVSVLLDVQRRIKKKWPTATEQQTFSAAVCVADAANAFGKADALSARRLSKCARLAGIELAPIR
ncbi:MAG: hypothetical protein JWN04_1054 [Myxococcaceae bacterium]|nr:hypothetical protein [Myxococcaceae bacterium]